MTATDSAVLAGCPFCGGERVGEFHHIVSGIPDSWHVECLAEDCGCGTCHHETRAEAIAAWNRRPESADNALLRVARDALDSADSILPSKTSARHGIKAALNALDAHLSRPRPARDEGQKP